MPCRYCPDESGSTRVEYRDNPETKKLLDKVTALLCGLLTHMNFKERNIQLAKNSRLKAWWVEHQKQDKARLERQRNKREHEKTKKNALNKLTDKEKKALGLR
jgi:hypothetical protein